MMLTKTATLKDIQQAAALQAWHFREMLNKADFTPFQQAYFLNQLADACLDVSESIIEQNQLGGLMAEVKASVKKPRKLAETLTPKPRRTRKPRLTPPETPDAE